SVFFHHAVDIPSTTPFPTRRSSDLYINNANKPSTKNYIRAMELMGTDRSNTVFVGDQLFTDVWGAKRTGIRSILVKPIHPKEERSEEHTSELQSRFDLVCRLLLEKK